MKLAIMNDKNCRAWLVPQILMDLVESGKAPKRFVKWGDPQCRPSFWPEDLAKWETISNPAHPQKVKWDLPMVEIMKGKIKVDIKPFLF